jgi:hypothetical protein
MAFATNENAVATGIGGPLSDLHIHIAVTLAEAYNAFGFLIH